MTRRVLQLIALLTLLLLFAPKPATAHGYLLRAIPENRAVLERAPARVQYWFSEGLEPAFSQIIIRNPGGDIIAEGGLSESDDKLLTARLPIGLADGAYTVDLRLAFASDGHVITERRVFFVGQEVAGVGGSAASDQAIPLEIVWRAITLTATILVMGVCVAYAYVLLPAWGNRDYAAGGLPPRVMSRLYAIAFVALVFAVIGNLLALVQQTMVFFDVDAWEAITSGYWQTVRTGTRFGDTWNWRMLLLTLVGGFLAASIYFRREQPHFVRPFWTAAAWGMPLILFTYSISAHAAGSLVLPWLAIASDWLHSVAVGVWVGGLAALTLVLPTALAPLAGEPRRAALLAVLGRFTRLAFAAAIIVIATGIYNASNWFTEADDAATAYAASLALKVLMVGGLLLLGAAHHIALHPQRYPRYKGVIARVRGFITTLRLEVAFGLLTLVLAGWLSATPVPQPTLPPQPPPPSATTQIGDYDMTLTISPGGPGVNTYDLQILRGGAAAQDVTAYIQLVNATLARRGQRHWAELSGDGLYVAAGADISSAGEWQALIDIVDGEIAQRAAFVLPIRADAVVQLTRPATIINILAMFGVLAAVGLAFAPDMRRMTTTFDLRPVTIGISLFALLVGVGVVAAGVWLSDESSRQNEAALYPLPQIVNTVLPDAASLERGRALLSADCGWLALPELVELTSRLERQRDEQLFALTRDGWRSLPPCSPALTDQQRWDVVNALRALADGA
jgi:copper transport protein